MITNQGSIDALRTVLKLTALDARIKLAQNNALPLDADLVLSDLVECDFVGYADVDCSSLPDPVLNGSSQAESDSATLTFTAGALTGPQTAYFLYVQFDDDTGTPCLLGVQRLLTPQTVTNPGDVIQAVASFFCFDGTP